MSDFDAEMFALMRSYCGKDPRVPETVSEEAMSESARDAETWSLADFKAMIAKAEATIPPEHLPSAMVTLRAFGDYASGCLEMTYVRPESADETQCRVDRAAQYARDTLTSERTAYERLKQKYGG